MSHLSVVLAVYNEEKNLEACLLSVRDLAQEIVIVDGGSSDRTVEIAKKFTDKVIQTDNPPIFHINKQKALDAATNSWVLQLDADERITPELASEIKQVIAMTDEQRGLYESRIPSRELQLRHIESLQARDGHIGTSSGPIVAYFIPRLNYMLGGYLKHGGAYPDSAIRLIRKEYARFPCKSVHEMMDIQGKVSMLHHDMLHVAEPTFSRYLERSNRYTQLQAQRWYDNYQKISEPGNHQPLDQETPNIDTLAVILWTIIHPLKQFLLIYLRHGGFKDGFPGFVWAMYSSLHIATSYVKYWEMRKTSH